MKVIYEGDGVNKNRIRITITDMSKYNKNDSYSFCNVKRYVSFFYHFIG